MVSEVEVQRFLASYVGNGYGNGYGFSNGDGFSNGNSFSNGYGYGYGNGNGNGYGINFSNGNGYGFAYGKGIKEIAGYSLYPIDEVYTAFESIHGEYAKGYTIRHNTILVPCYIAKYNGYFGHGETLHDAVKDATDKYIEDRPLGERIDEFVKAHPDYDKAYDDLFDWHHTLTGSCEFGRKQWCENHGLTPESSLTVRQFCEMTANDYGGNAIRQLKERYEIQ